MSIKDHSKCHFSLDNNKKEFSSLLKLIIFSFIFLTFNFQAENSYSMDLRGFVELEGRLFANPAIHPNQENNSVSGALAPEFLFEFENNSKLYFSPFFRLDSVDEERTHFDLRELDLLIPKGDWEFRLGVRKVFWGVIETRHLVDIINQTDLVDSPDRERKLGQPMVNVSLIKDWGILDFFVMPYFRERTFQGEYGRLRPSIIIDTDKTQFESAAEQWHTDFALRYFNTFDKLDVGLSYFVGTNREPTFNVQLSDNRRPILVPFYETITQTGMDILFVTGNWIWKSESLIRTGLEAGDYWSSAFGLEYTFAGILGTGVDFGVLTEWLYDDRNDKATTPFENDISLALRIAANDVDDKTALIGVIQDIETEARFFFIEASQRFGEHWRLSLEFRSIMDQEKGDLLFDLRQDDFLQAALAYHF